MFNILAIYFHYKYVLKTLHLIINVLWFSKIDFKSYWEHYFLIQTCHVFFAIDIYSENVDFYLSIISTLPTYIFEYKTDIDIIHGKRLNI